MTDDANRPPAESGRLSRRTFLELSAAAGTLAALGGAGLALAGGDDLLRKKIPASGQKIPVIGLGTARTFGVDPSDAAAMKPLRAVMKRFYDGGGRLVDSSPMYGQAEAVTGKLARDLGITDKLFMATKVWTRGREAGIAEMERSEKLMRGGPLDLIQVHNLVDLDTQLETLIRWRAEKRVRYIGVTHSSDRAHEALTQVVERAPIDFVQLNYNLMDRDADKRLLPAAAHKGVAVLVNVPFGNGALFRRVRGAKLPPWSKEVGAKSWAQLFLKFVVSHPAVTCALPATSDPAHMTDNIGACHGHLPTAKQRARIAAFFDALPG